MKETYQVDTFRASLETQKLYSCGQPACFAVEVENYEVTATAPIGWKLRYLNWPALVEEMVSQRIIITKLENRVVRLV